MPAARTSRPAPTPEDEARIAEAEAALAALRRAYPQMLAAALDQLAGDIARLRADAQGADDSAREAVVGLIHDLKGQGQAFGHPRLSRAGALFGAIAARAPEGPLLAEAASAFLRLARAAVVGQPPGAGLAPLHVLARLRRR